MCYNIYTECMEEYIMKRINLTKYGFMRAEELDFSDDGSRFTCYRFMPGTDSHVSKCVYEGEVFLSAHVSGQLPYGVYSVLPHYNAANWKYNGRSIEGLTDEDLHNFYEDCIAYENEYRTAEATMVFPTLEELEEQCRRLQAKYRDELATACKLLADCANSGNVLKFGHTDWTQLLNYMKSIKQYIDKYNPKVYSSSIFNKGYSLEFVKPDIAGLVNKSWYLKEIEEYFDKVNK